MIVEALLLCRYLTVSVSWLARVVIRTCLQVVRVASLEWDVGQDDPYIFAINQTIRVKIVPIKKFVKLVKIPYILKVRRILVSTSLMKILMKLSVKLFSVTQLSGVSSNMTNNLSLMIPGARQYSVKVTLSIFFSPPLV
jgi:hypothetical protein